MKKFDEELFKKEIQEVIIKHKLKNVVVGAETPAGFFLGLLGVTGLHDFLGLTEVVANSARLYQAEREKIFVALDDMAQRRDR